MKHRKSRRDIDKDKMFSKLMPTFPVKNDDDYDDNDNENEETGLSNSKPSKRPADDLTDKSKKVNSSKPEIPKREPDFRPLSTTSEQSSVQASSSDAEDTFQDLQSINLYQQLQNTARRRHTDPQTQAFLNAARSAAREQAQKKEQGPHITEFRPEVISTVKPKPAVTEKESLSDEDDGVQLINIIEYVVESKLESIMTAFKCCSCRKCRQAAMVKILNATLPEYTYILPSEIRSLIEENENKYKSLNQSIIRNILELKSSPPH